MQRGLPGLRGLPVRPYAEFSVYSGSDVWLELTFVDRTGTPETPTSVVYQVDNLTDCVNALQATTITPSGTTQEIDIPGSVNQTYTAWRSSQLMQVSVTATYSDGSIDREVFIYEVLAIQTPGAA